MTRAVKPAEAKTPAASHAARPAEASPKKALAFSAAVHLLLVAGLLGYSWLKPSRPATAVFELVSAEPARLGPPTPKAPEAVPETPPEPEPVEPVPEAPALKPAPKDPKVAAKPEPKKPARDSVAKAAPAAPSAPTGSGKTGDGPVQITNSGDPGLGRWGARVKAIIQQAWNPAKGYDVDLPAMTVVSFNVDVDEGTVSNIKVVQSSGNAQLDEEGVRALKRRDRLLPPRNFVSPGFSEDILQVRYEFIYNSL